MSSQPLPAGAPVTRREQILAAAAELFARHGFHGVGIDDIGAAVGISGPALYRHFRSKDAMLGEMLTSISERLLDGGQARVDAASNAEEALQALIGWHVDSLLMSRASRVIHRFGAEPNSPASGAASARRNAGGIRHS